MHEFSVHVALIPARAADCITNAEGAKIIIVEPTEILPPPARRNGSCSVKLTFRILSTNTREGSTPRDATTYPLAGLQKRKRPVEAMKSGVSPPFFVRVAKTREGVIPDGGQEMPEKVKVNFVSPKIGVVVLIMNEKAFLYPLGTIEEDIIDATLDDPH
jgi:hypothetical protein